MWLGTTPDCLWFPGSHPLAVPMHALTSRAASEWSPEWVHGNPISAHRSTTARPTVVGTAGWSWASGMTVPRTGATAAARLRPKSPRRSAILNASGERATLASPASGLTVAAWFETWLTTIAPRTVSQSTLDSTYEPKVRLGGSSRGWASTGWTGSSPNTSIPSTCGSQNEGLKPNTVLQIHRIISRALKVAWKRGKVARNVARAGGGTHRGRDRHRASEPVRKPAGSSRPPRSGRTAPAGRSHWPVGIRQCEALGLRWRYVDLDAGTIEVGWQLRCARYRHGCPDPVACTAGRHRAPCPPGCARHQHKPGCGQDCAKRGHACPVVKRPCPDHCVGHARECPQRTGGGWHFTRRKGVKPGKGQAKLVLTLPLPLTAQLREHRRQQTAQRLAPGRPGKTGIWSSAHPPAARSIPTTTGKTGGNCSLRPKSGPHGYTMRATRPPRCCWSRASASGSCSRSSAIPSSARPSATPT